jgi:hypothetical protein
MRIPLFQGESLPGILTRKREMSENAKSGRLIRNPGREEARKQLFLVSWLPYKSIVSLSRFRSFRAFASKEPIGQAASNEPGA